MIKYYISSPGFRTKHVTLATTLLDSKVYPTTEIMRLYGQRWQVELDLRHLKTTLDMDILRGKTPEIVRKEIGSDMEVVVRYNPCPVSILYNIS